MLVGTVLTAVLVKYTFPYGWSWTLALLFGAMFSATDPVAVVAVLKEVRCCAAARPGPVSSEGLRLSRCSAVAVNNDTHN